MEPYEPGIKYVALSHVWADGLGNPRRNALPNCQVVRICNTVAELNRTLNESNDPRSEYLVWVHTICCPVELEGKAIALERIADVYKNSTHVLVLDSSLTCLNTETCDLAERLLRTFSFSAWMRRLWTLQGTQHSFGHNTMFGHGPTPEDPGRSHPLDSIAQGSKCDAG